VTSHGTKPYVSAEFFANRPFPDLIALDVDDTLVPHMGTVGERVMTALARAREAGIVVALATGRTLSTTAPVARAAGLDGWLVCSNGAVLATVEPETVIDTITFDPRPALDFLVTELPDAVFAVEDVHGVFHTTRMFGAGALGLSVREVPFEHLLTDPVVRLVVRSDAHADTGLGHIAAQMGMHSVIFGVGETAWMDIGPAGVNKATMLAELCTRLDLNHARTLVVGDFYNDVEMLRWAGTGVAMGSAPESVMAAADARTSDVPGDGVAEIIDALLQAVPRN
jgi:Cof subfamily protein (haloacid dehalogenase superfamily)